MNIALKEANETAYWLMLLKDSEYIDESSFNSIHADCVEVLKMLISIVKTSKKSVDIDGGQWTVSISSNNCQLSIFNYQLIE